MIYQCRICLDNCDNKLLCDCKGSIGFCHKKCLNNFININGYYCEICKKNLIKNNYKSINNYIMDIMDIIDIIIKLIYIYLIIIYYISHNQYILILIILFFFYRIFNA